MKVNVMVTMNVDRVPYLVKVRVTMLLRSEEGGAGGRCGIH